MLHSLLRAALSQRLLVVVVALVLCAFGLRESLRLSVDAFPDVTNVQVQVATEFQGRSPEEIERFVTVPLEIAMTGLPGLVEMRSLNKSGLSIITLVFTDKTDVYFARQLVTERLIEVGSRMPPGVTPVLGPVSTGLGEVYQYTLEHPDDGKRALTPAELAERRIVQDWVVRPLLRSIPGVAEINSQGGYVRQFQVVADPASLRYHGLTVQHLADAIAANNANAGGGVLPMSTEQFLVRGVGLIRSVEDIAGIVVKETGGVPVYVSNLGEVRIGSEVRQGAIIKGGYTEAVSGIVLMMRAGNAKEIVTRVKERVEEINARGMLPGGLKIVPYYDRTELVDSALWTVGKVLIEGIFLVVVVLFIFLGDVRSSLIVVATLVITPLVTFIMMNRLGMSANLMSLGGLAIAIGLMVDATVVVVENVYHRLGSATDKGSR
ncbi:MAG: efflux RND transporter permease subunit, partial [Ramlibacter sp.]